MEIIKQMVFNLALLLVILFLFQIYQESKGEKSNSHKNVFWYFIISIIVCLLLSNIINVHMRYDLRVVPLILGCLYLPRKLGAKLFIYSILIRALFGINFGFFLSIVIYGVQTICILLIHDWFHSLKAKKKIVVSVVISILSSILFIIVTKVFNQSLTFSQWGIYILSTSIGTGIMCAAFEFYNRNYAMREKIIKSEKIEAVSHLAASISHEVRNPLTSIKGFLQLISDDDFNKEKKDEFIKIALSEIHRAEQIINDYLTFAKPSLNSYEKIKIHEHLTKTINIIQPLAIMSSVRIRKKLDTNAYFYGDFSTFQQCIINFLKNSIDAMPSGGILHVESYLDDETAVIIIKDTGIGMTSEQARKLGEPYFSTKGTKGTGLGLMVSYGIIRSMKGIIEVESIIDKGTTFTIKFPVTSINEKSY
jgi:two-component system sporulation sensor kinase B